MPARRIIAHKRAKERLALLKRPEYRASGRGGRRQGRTITLGGTTLELNYLGLNHSDSNLVMRLPKEKIIFVVDTIPVGTFPGRGMIDFYPLETEAVHQEGAGIGLGAADPRSSRTAHGGRLGTKKDAQDVLTLMQDASAEMKKSRARRQMLGAGREGFQAAEIRQAGPVTKAASAVRRATLLRASGGAAPDSSVGRIASRCSRFRETPRSRPSERVHGT